MKLSRTCSYSSLRWFGLVLAVLIGCSSARGAALLPPVIISPVSGALLTEGGGPVTLDFMVHNPNGVTLILDYAFASITPGPPDLTDFAQFTGTNGNGGLVSGDLTIGPNATGNYIYSFSSPADLPGAPENADFGVDPVIFAIEMSEEPAVCVGPPVNTISSKTPLVVWVDLSGCGDTPNAGALTSILNGQNPQSNVPPNNLLYTNGLIGQGVLGPFGMSSVQVNDVPEASSLFLTVAGLLGLAFCHHPPSTNHCAPASDRVLLVRRLIEQWFS